jgi:nucleoside 2-deoxyribosyltransferase
MTRIATYNWGAAFINQADQIVVVVDQFNHMDKSEVAATARTLGLAITKTVKSIHQLGTKGHVYNTQAVS